MISAVIEWKEKHPDLYEFLMFNIMSNVATVTNFIVLWISTGWLFRGFSGIHFQWFIFEYSVDNGGLGGFLAFLLAYVCAQVVNFIVQRKVVFGATVNIMKVMHWYILTVLVAGIISVWLPPYIIELVKPFAKGFSPTIANAVNIFLQVVINYPMLKFVIMKKD